VEQGLQGSRWPARVGRDRQSRCSKPTGPPLSSGGRNLVYDEGLAQKSALGGGSLKGPIEENQCSSRKLHENAKGPRSQLLNRKKGPLGRDQANQGSACDAEQVLRIKRGSGVEQPGKGGIINLISTGGGKKSSLITINGGEQIPTSFKIGLTSQGRRNLNQGVGPEESRRWFGGQMVGGGG